MNVPPRLKQDAVIGMAVLVVLLALWRLHSRPRSFGGFGSWAETNIFGASTLSLISGAGQGRGEDQPLPPPTAPGASSNQADLPANNPPAAPASHAPALAGDHSSNGPPAADPGSTNLINTNGPVTIIAVAPADLVETPTRTATSVNVPEAASIERRLGEASAKGGDIQISLSWQNFNDLDLHCIDPAGEEIFFSNRRSSRTGGELDVDRNAQPPFTMSPVENIYWPLGVAPRGLYKIYVVYYAQHCGTEATSFLVRTVVQGKTNYFRSIISYTGLRERLPINNLHYDPSNPNPAQRSWFGP
jgi:hypothetical protein